MDIKGVLFDFDGTLTVPGAINFLEIKESLGCPPEVPILEFIESLDKNEQQKAYSFLDRHEEEAARISFPAQDAESVIRELKKKGLPLGIITRNSLNAVLLALNNFDHVTADDFAIILTRDDGIPKPDPAGVLIAAEKMGILPEELLLVGDFSLDIMAGHAAGARTVLIVHDTTRIIPPHPEPDYTIHHFRELIPLISPLTPIS
ncbi:MAG: HAD-IA family hydrolase [Deltaproteobacteria bacterium]|nr:HAD-IA family hydrolase [Deltaproteobacteria bacterium]